VQQLVVAVVGSWVELAVAVVQAVGLVPDVPVQVWHPVAVGMVEGGNCRWSSEQKPSP